MAELEYESQGDLIGFMRMEPATFHELLMRLSPRLTTADTNWRMALEPDLKLAVALCYLVTGNIYRDLAYAFCLPHNSISKFLIDVCQAIVSKYGDEVVKMPNDEEEWCVIIDKFSARWNFPKTIGAIDGNHFTLKAPAKSCTVYHNYKGFISIILLDLVDGDCKFLWVDVGPTGPRQTVRCSTSQSSRTSWRMGPLAFHILYHFPVLTQPSHTS